MFEETRQALETGNGTRSLEVQCTLVIRDGTISHSIINQVVMLPIPGKIFLRVINHVVCANGAYHTHIPCAAYAGDFSPECFGNLHGKCPHPTRGTIHQNLLP